MISVIRGLIKENNTYYRIAFISQISTCNGSSGFNEIWFKLCGSTRNEQLCFNNVQERDKIYNEIISAMMENSSELINANQKETRFDHLIE
jgi:hypothetical protein